MFSSLLLLVLVLVSVLRVHDVVVVVVALMTDTITERHVDTAGPLLDYTILLDKKMIRTEMDGWMDGWIGGKMYVYVCV